MDRLGFDARIREGKLLTSLPWDVFSDTVVQKMFRQSAAFEEEGPDLVPVDYGYIHAVSKDAIHLLEGVDAALRSMECTIQAQSETRTVDTFASSTARDALRHRKELFHSTRLRLVSIDQRLKNIINLVGSPFLALAPACSS